MCVLSFVFFVVTDDFFQKRRALIGDLCIAVGIPVLVMILREFILTSFGVLFSDIRPDYVVQGHRFDILEDVGCYPTIYNTLPAYFLVFMWPVVLGCISFVYSGQLPSSIALVDSLLI